MDRTQKFPKLRRFLKTSGQRYDGTKNLSRQTKSAYIILLHLHRGMHIAVQGNAGVRMSQQLAQGFRIEPVCDADRGIGVPEQMEWHASQLTGFQNSLEAILHRSRFYWLCRIRKQKSVISFLFL